jgi:hypothetical protein
MVDQRTWEACLIDCTDIWTTYTRTDPKYVTSKDKTYRYTQLGELVWSIVVEHAPEHKVICGSKPIGEKHEESETAVEQQPRRASGCEATTLSRG